MKKHLKTLSAITIACFANLTPNIATAQYAAHVHGHAELTMAIENNRIQLQLISPAEALVGFEYQAKTEQEVNKVVATKKLLSSIEHLIQFSGTDCQMTDYKVNVEGLMSAEEHHDHKEHDSHHNDHEHQHEHKEQDDHSSHAEISADYALTCIDTAKISKATISLFKHFSALEKVQVVWLTATKQGSATTTANNNSLDFN